MKKEKSSRVRSTTKSALENKEDCKFTKKLIVIKASKTKFKVLDQVIDK